jgi:hypothetical protein
MSYDIYSIQLNLTAYKWIMFPASFGRIENYIYFLIISTQGIHFLCFKVKTKSSVSHRCIQFESGLEKRNTF